MSDARDRIVTQPIFKSLISLSIPAVGSSIFIIVFEVVDMFWVGKLGAKPVAALGTASFFVWMLRALILTVATGALAMVSRRTGENAKKRILSTSANAILSSGLFSVFIILVMAPIVMNVFRWIPLDNEVSNLARDYASVFLSGFIFVCLMVTGEHIIRGLGNTKIPMMITGFSLFLNGILDPIFIFTLKMGLIGAAYATILAHLVGCLLMLGAVLHFLKDIRTEPLKMNTRFFNIFFLPMLKIGAPIALSGAAFSIIYLVLSGIISFFGSAALAAVGIGHRIEAFPYFIAFGFSIAVSTMVGQNLGAGEPKRAKASVFMSLKIASAILLLMSLVFYFFAERLYGLFIADPDVIAQGTHYLKIIAIFEVFLAFEVILEGAFAGAGDTKPPFLIVFPITLLRIPLSYFFSITLGLGSTAIWMVISVTTFLKGVLLFIWFLRGKWMAKMV